MKGSAVPVVALALAALAGCGDDVVDPSAATGVEWRLESCQRPDFSVLTLDPGGTTLRYVR